jgi:phospholipid-binding lipoprotein MlaA
LRHSKRLAIAVLLLVAATSAGLAQTRGDAAARVTQILRDSEAGVQSEIALARSLRTPATEEALRRKALQQAEYSVHAYVVGAIAANPPNAPEVVAGAVGAAPQFRETILRVSVGAFPFLGSAITAAAGAVPAVALAAPAPAQVVAADPAPRPATAAPTRPTAEPAAEPEDNDPLEGFNRAVFAFNDVFDRFLLRPIAYGYGFITPDFIKAGVRNIFGNLTSPVVLANNLLQFDAPGAIRTTGRFVVNSTVGVLGFFDVAQEIGIPRHTADFGQTLHGYGIGSGPYLVLPLLGPSSVRDGVGRAVDVFLDPLTYYLDFYPRLAVTATNAVTLRETLIKPLDDLRANSVDYYAALRAAYFQDRAVVLRKGTAASEPSAADKAFEEFE